MYAPPLPSPRRFSISIFLSLTLLLLLTFLLLLSSTHLCTPPTHPCPSLFNHDSFLSSFSFPSTALLHGDRGSGSATTTTLTSDNKNNATKAPVDTTKAMAVEDLYQYALASRRFRNVKHERSLRRYLRSHPVMERGRGWWWYGWWGWGKRWD